MFNQSTGKKKKHNLKVENFSLFSKLVRDLNLESRLIDSSEGLFQTGGRSQHIYEVLQKSQLVKTLIESC